MCVSSIMFRMLEALSFIVLPKFLWVQALCSAFDGDHHGAYLAGCLAFTLDVGLVIAAVTYSRPQEEA